MQEGNEMNEKSKLNVKTTNFKVRFLTILLKFYFCLKFWQNNEKVENLLKQGKSLKICIEISFEGLLFNLQTSV